MRLIDADALLKGKTDHEMISTHLVWNAPTIEPTITYEQVKEYCRKRCLVIVTAETFNDMKVIWNLLQKSDDYEEPEINPCRGCTDYDGHGGCKSNGGCATRYCAYCGTEITNANNND